MARNHRVGTTNGIAFASDYLLKSIEDILPLYRDSVASFFGKKSQASPLPTFVKLLVFAERTRRFLERTKSLPGYDNDLDLTCGTFDEEIKVGTKLDSRLLG